MNEQQQVIAWLGGALIVLQFWYTGQWKALWSFVWLGTTDQPGHASPPGDWLKNWQNIFGTAGLLVLEILFVGTIVLFADGEDFGPPTLGLVLLLALLAVWAINNGDLIAKILGVSNAGLKPQKGLWNTLEG